MRYYQSIEEQFGNARSSQNQRIPNTDTCGVLTALSIARTGDDKGGWFRGHSACAALSRGRAPFGVLLLSNSGEAGPQKPPPQADRTSRGDNAWLLFRRVDLLSLPLLTYCTIMDSIRCIYLGMMYIVGIRTGQYYLGTGTSTDDRIPRKG